jgi:hypothetical protein
MSQRISRKSKNNTDFISVNTGSHNSLHSRNADPVVQTPQKATGDIKPEPETAPAGLAKASPAFKPVVSQEPQTKEEEKKVIAKNSVPVSKTEKQDSEKEPVDD